MILIKQGNNLPAFLDVPEPRFAPQNDQPKNKSGHVIHAPEGVLAEFGQIRWLVLYASHAKPTFQLPFGHVNFFRQCHTLEFFLNVIK